MKDFLLGFFKVGKLFISTKSIGRQQIPKGKKIEKTKLTQIFFRM
jgi:hypothetical protein